MHKKVVNLLLLTWDDEKTIENDSHTIKILPVWKWLLKNNT
jgi:predicted AAA+ superfamily ATPase